MTVEGSKGNGERIEENRGKKTGLVGIKVKEKEQSDDAF